MSTDKKPITLSLHDVDAQQVAQCGGKGANLAKLAAAGFNVPQARIVGVDVYREWFSQLSSSLSMECSDKSAGRQGHGLSAGFTMEDTDALANQCRELREQLAKVTLPIAIETALRLELASLCEQGPVSVRSSATLEDRQGAAFAGQHDTFLGVRGIDLVIERIVDCYVSLWEDRAVRYRFEHGFDTDDISMAVVVQQMVNADIAGVAFSAHPISGSVDQILINSSFGLGETVVSGDGEIDQYTVAADGSIIDTHIGQKEQALLLNECGTSTTELVSADQHRSSLSHHQIKAVAMLAKSCEQFFCFPQDIEWAFDDHGLQLLQSRPISELPARWTRQESAERFPSPVTPLTWDFTTGGFHESLTHSLNLMGLPEFKGRWFERFDGYIYGNQTAVELYTAGQQIDFQSLDDLAGRVDEFREKYTWVQELPSQWSNNLERFLLRLGALNDRNLTELSDAALWQYVGELEKVGNAYFLPNIAISITQGLLHRTLYKLSVLVCGEHAPIVYDNLTCYCDTKTARVNRDLYNLYVLIMKQPALWDLLQNKRSRELVESCELNVYPEFYRAFSGFIANHGHREVEFDAYYPTWGKQPWVVLDNLRLMSTQESIESPTARDAQLRSRQHRTELEFLDKLPDSLKGFAKELVQLSRTYTGLDDVEHYHTTRLSVPFREAILELGNRFVTKGVIDQSDDLFFLPRDTVRDLINGDVDVLALKQNVQLNKQRFLQQKASEPCYELGVHEDDSYDKLSTALSGLPGAPGIAQGNTCIVRTSDDFASFIPGSILVARTTNPAWTPLFYAASAVITESGGPLSHGAVTAREIGIPAVVAARGAISALGDNQRVRVNGAVGEVLLLD